jgi:osmoprotectant transport system permease protein
MKRSLLAALLLALLPQTVRAETITVASKKFTESYVLGEIAKRTLEQAHFDVEYCQGLGATGIIWTALKMGQITCYPDYTGTIGQEIFKVKGRMTPDAVRAALAREGVGMTGELGFNNTYALAMRRGRAQSLRITKVSDLRAHPDLVLRFTPEFLSRHDGWEPLCRHYRLAMTNVAGMEHALGYQALAHDLIDMLDAYSTDAKLIEYDLVTLEDDLDFFPKYRAVFLYRMDAPRAAIAALEKLAGTIPQDEMIRLNGEAERSNDFAAAAALYFAGGHGAHDSEGRAGGVGQRPAAPTETSARRIARFTGRHLQLVGTSLLLAILVGVPLGVVASRPGTVSQAILGLAGTIQTIPSIALLMLLLQVLGIGVGTAIAALFLYSLLPIVRNTATGLQEIPPGLRESAIALGLEPGARLRLIYLPMASRTVLAGIKTSAIINVGNATLAAFIGAGGLGEPIVSGLTLNDNGLVLQGAIPAAVLALLVQFGFDLLDHAVIPRGLRLPRAS